MNEWQTRVLERLISLRELLSSPDHWTQRADARDAFDCPWPPDSSEACKWCLTGGIYMVTANVENSGALAIEIRFELRRYLPYVQFGRLAMFNDHSTYEDVIGLVDRTIRGMARYN